MYKIAFFCVLFFSVGSKAVDRPAHILMFHPWNTRSHRIQQNALLEGLLARGHLVTGVFPQQSAIINPNYTEIVVADG